MSISTNAPANPTLPDLTATGSLANTTDDVRLPLAGYQGAGFSLTGAWTATVVAQVSADDGNTWNHATIWRVAGSSGTQGRGATSTGSTGNYIVCDIAGMTHVRVIITAYTSGTVVVQLNATQACMVQEGFTGTPGGGVPDRVAQIGLQDQTGTMRALQCTNTAPAGTEYGMVVREPPYNYSNINTNTTTTVKSGAGILHSITVNGTGAGETVTVYDNTSGSGTKIATITPAAGSTLIFDCKFSTGLTVVTAGTTPADLTINYL
jgi:hypothetical protein